MRTQKKEKKKNKNYADHIKKKRQGKRKIINGGKRRNIN
jgi:hypothetical protein